MADAAVTFLLEYVQKLIGERINLLSGAETNLKALQNELELMKAFLVDSTKTREKGEVFIKLGKQIREAVYEAEDTLDTCLTNNNKANSRLINFKSLDLAGKVKEVLEKLKPMFERAMRILNDLPKLDASSFRPGASDDKLKKTQFLRENNVVGFADEEDTLISYLKQPTDELDVISIVGMPGLGKTTLAWKIYRKTEIKFEFPMLIWVYVSQELSVRDVFLTILKRFTQEDMSTKNVSELTRLVRDHLSRGKFLLFMDDVWTADDWRKIEAALPRDNKWGKVLITSRDERVAMVANRKRVPHKLRFLNEKESWELLELEVFGGNNTCPQELEGLGKQIAAECSGVPLVVVVIGGILVQKCDNRRDLWERVSVSVNEHLRYDVEKRTENIISLSYDKLPYDLRDCFLYLGMFPEDAEISAWKLTRLWIGEGFIQPNGWMTMEEVAEDKLKDLVARNLVMVEKTKANGDIKSCRVHDMIREFCQNEAAFMNQNLFLEVKKKKRQRVFDPDAFEMKKHRRICIHSNVPEFLQHKLKGPRVRSFVCFSKDPIILPPECTPIIPQAFDLLRVMDVNPIKFTKFPPKLTKLMHLRYIALSGYDLKSLPEAVLKLWNLQTIKIDTTSREFEIKVDILKMKQLRHFKTKAAIVLNELKGGGEGGGNLQTLSRLSAKCCREELFNRAPNLQNLGIRGNLTDFVDTNYLGRLESLHKLKLVHDVFPTTGDNALHRVPHQSSFPPNLRILTLSSTKLTWDHMDTLGSLNKLEVLKLKEMAFKGTLWEAKGGAFRHLESLHIARTDLEIWMASDDAFPKLKNLLLKNCETLQEIPPQLGKSLQLVEIERVSKTLVQSAEKIKAEKQQMQEGQVRANRGGFKLKISPGDASASTSH